MLMLPQRWHVGLTLSHLTYMELVWHFGVGIGVECCTFAREQASQEARSLRGFPSPPGLEETMLWWRGGAMEVMATIGGDCEGWEVYDWRGTAWNMVSLIIREQLGMGEALLDGAQ
jgi:hypothetical protein